MVHRLVEQNIDQDILHFLLAQMEELSKNHRLYQKEANADHAKRLENYQPYTERYKRSSTVKRLKTSLVRKENAWCVKNPAKIHNTRHHQLSLPAIFPKPQQVNTGETFSPPVDSNTAAADALITPDASDISGGGDQPAVVDDSPILRKIIDQGYIEKPTVEKILEKLGGRRPLSTDTPKEIPTGDDEGDSDVSRVDPRLKKANNIPICHVNPWLRVPVFGDTTATPGVSDSVSDLPPAYHTATTAPDTPVPNTPSVSPTAPDTPVGNTPYVTPTAPATVISPSGDGTPDVVVITRDDGDNTGGEGSSDSAGVGEPMEQDVTQIPSEVSEKETPPKETLSARLSVGRHIKIEDTADPTTKTFISTKFAIQKAQVDCLAKFKKLPQLNFLWNPEGSMKNIHNFINICGCVSCLKRLHAHKVTSENITKRCTCRNCQTFYFYNTISDERFSIKKKTTVS